MADPVFTAYITLTSGESVTIKSLTDFKLHQDTVVWTQRPGRFFPRRELRYLNPRDIVAVQIRQSFRVWLK